MMETSKEEESGNWGELRFECQMKEIVSDERTNSWFCQELRVGLNSKLNTCSPFLWKRDRWMWFGEKGDNSTCSNLRRMWRQTELHHWMWENAIQIRWVWSQSNPQHFWVLIAIIMIIAFCESQIDKCAQKRRFVRSMYLTVLYTVISNVNLTLIKTMVVEILIDLFSLDLRHTCRDQVCLWVCV